MSARTERRLRALGSLIRKQQGEVEEASVANARARTELERAEDALRATASRVDGVEREVRERIASAPTLSLDGMRLWSLHLASLRTELQERRAEHDGVSARAAESAAWLSRCIQNRKATERITERVHAAEAIETRRRADRLADEQWLLRRDGGAP